MTYKHAATGAPLVRLTKRERRILVLIKKGKDSKEIAHILGSTEGTMRSAIFRLHQGLRVRGRGMRGIADWCAANPLALQKPKDGEDPPWVPLSPHPPGCCCTEHCLMTDDEVVEELIREVAAERRSKDDPDPEEEPLEPAPSAAAPD